MGKIAVRRVWPSINLFQQTRKKIAPVRIVMRRNTVPVKDVEDVNLTHMIMPWTRITKENEHGDSDKALGDAIDPDPALGDAIDAQKHQSKGEFEPSREVLRK